jgi:hypothetical protein
MLCPSDTPEPDRRLRHPKKPRGAGDHKAREKHEKKLPGWFHRRVGLTAEGAESAEFFYPWQKNIVVIL